MPKKFKMTSSAVALESLRQQVLHGAVLTGMNLIACHATHNGPGSATSGPGIKEEARMFSEQHKIGFGGGCHWCTEAVFASLNGVSYVEQGFIGADAPDDNVSEGVILTFQPDKISLASLIEIHLRTHSSTSNHTMRLKYRSAVYAMDDAQAEDARRILAEVQRSFDLPLVTRVLPCRTFVESEERFQRYAEKNAGGPFCTTYIDPKLALLRKQFSGLLRSTCK